MPRPSKTIAAGNTRAKLDGLTAAVRREAEGAEADPFDDATIAAVTGLAEALKGETEALTEMASGGRRGGGGPRPWPGR